MKSFPFALLFSLILSNSVFCNETNQTISLFGISLTPTNKPGRAAEIQFEKGLACFTGEGAEKNLGRAVEHFKAAAELGHPQAQFNLGLCYMNGTGVEQSDQEAAKWFRQAVEQEIKEAAYPLGICHYNMEHYTEAYAWALFSASGGDTRLKDMFDPMYSEEEISAGKKQFEVLLNELKNKRMEQK